MVLIEGTVGDPLTTGQRQYLDQLNGGCFTACAPEQEGYYAQYGSYFQGLRLDGISPNLAGHPTDQWQTWAAVGMGDIAALAAHGVVDGASIEHHVYDGPWGRGWVHIFRAPLGIRRFRRVMNAGPESYRDTDWVEEV